MQKGSLKRWESITTKINVGLKIMVREIEKTRILQYLQFAENEVDLLNFTRWLETYSDGLFHVNKGKRPKEKNNYFADKQGGRK